MHEEPFRFDNNKDNAIQTQSEDLKRRSSHGDTQTADQHAERCSAPLVVRDAQVDTARRAARKEDERGAPGWLSG